MCELAICMSLLYHDCVHTAYLLTCVCLHLTLQYPVGYPEVLLPPNIDVNNFDQYYGVAKVRITPPRSLRLPVLPLRANNKLLFCLCAKCGMNGVPINCHCSDDDRSWVGKCVMCFRI